MRSICFEAQVLKKTGEIGLEVGFFDQSHFIRVFKKFCGTTPKQTRRWGNETDKVNSVQF